MGGLTRQQRALAALVGEWEGPSKTWFAPGEAPHEARSHARFRPVLGGMFIQQEYESSLDGEPFEGLAFYGWDTNEEKHVVVWVDTFHMSTGPMLSKGLADEGELLNVLGTYQAGDEVWGWRTVIKIDGQDRLEVVAYNITPAGEEAKAIEVQYRRVKGGGRRVSRAHAPRRPAAPRRARGRRKGGRG